MPYTLADVNQMVVDHGKNPRVHPNGFIQLDIAPTEDGWEESKKQGHSGAHRRLHIWNPPGIELPHQKTVNEIHDHVFDMHSTVIRGVLRQRLYEFTAGRIGPLTHELYRAVYDKTSNSRLEPLGIRGVLRCYRTFPVFPVEDNDTYTQPAFTLHDSEAKGLVVTVMEKTKVRPGEATVVCPLDSPPDNDFDRATAAPEEDLWRAIEMSLA